MNDQMFQTKVDDLFFKIEEWIERSESILDFEMQAGILTLFLPDGSQLILSRQSQLQEIWLASPQGAFHFRDSEEGWVTQQGQGLLPTLVTVIKSQAHITLDLMQFSP